MVTYLGTDEARSFFALPENGKILAAGYVGTGIFSTNYNISLLEYRSDGTIEQSFGTNGKTITDIGGTDEAFAGAIQKDGKIIVAGRGNSIDITLVRYYGHNILSSADKENNFSNLQKQNNTSIHLSPNPVKDILQIEGLSPSTKEISIYDSKGKALQQAITANSSHSFNVKQLAAGIYFIRVDEGHKTTVLKFIKE